MDFTDIRFEKRDRIGYLTLNRPQALNALSPNLVQEAQQALAQVREDRDIKALVITGEGRAFSAGADLKVVQEGFQNLSLSTAFTQSLNRFFFALEELPVPVIAVVKGFALAGGLELAIACDLILAAEDATIGDQHINFALTPGGGNTQRLPRKLGLQKAAYLLYTGGWLSGKEAQEWGLVFKAAPADRLDEELEKILSMLRVKSRPALGVIKRAVNRGIQMPTLRDAVDYEVSAFIEYVATSDHAHQGIRAFLEKRQPEF